MRWERTRFAAIPGDMLNAALTSLSTALVVGAVCALTALVCNWHFFTQATKQLKESLELILSNDPGKTPKST